MRYWRRGAWSGARLRRWPCDHLMVVRGAGPLRGAGPVLVRVVAGGDASGQGPSDSDGGEHGSRFHTTHGESSSCVDTTALCRHGCCCCYCPGRRVFATKVKVEFAGGAVVHPGSRSDPAGVSPVRMDIGVPGSRPWLLGEI